MINRGLVNRLPINRSLLQGDDIYVTLNFRESLRGWLKAASDAYIASKFNAALQGNAAMAQGVRHGVSFAAELRGSATGTAGIRRGFAFNTQLNGRLHVGADIYLQPINMPGALQGSLFVGANIFSVVAISEQILGEARFGADIYVSPALHEALFGYLSIESIIDTATIITGEIPPGGVLVIDAESFNVLLNDQDAIGMHSGDWIWIGKQTITLTCIPGDGLTPNWEVFFVAKYL